MLAYKGFNERLQATLGTGIYQFTPGGTYETKQCKTGRDGFHCCEYILNCTGYYGINGHNRFFVVEAEGDINEDDIHRISCTKITIKKELDQKGIAVHALRYMILHPTMEWEKEGMNLRAAAGQAEILKKSGIAIARGEQPMAKAAAGSVIGLLREKDPGLYTDAIVDIVGGHIFKKPDTWYTVENGKVKEVRN